MVNTYRLLEYFADFFSLEVMGIACVHALRWIISSAIHSLIQKLRLQHTIVRLQFVSMKIKTKPSRYLKTAFRGETTKMRNHSVVVVGKAVGETETAESYRKHVHAHPACSLKHSYMYFLIILSHGSVDNTADETERRWFFESYEFTRVTLHSLSYLFINWTIRIITGSR